MDATDGLVILDYKTVLISDAKTWDERVASYSRQLQLYAAAAEAIFRRPLRRAALVFLRGRKVVDVPLATPALPDVLGA